MEITPLTYSIHEYSFNKLITKRLRAFFSVFSTKSKAFHGELELELQLRIGIKSLNSSADVWKHCQTVILCMVHGSF